MWNTQYSNSRCNEINKIKEHKMHLERLVTAKSTLDVKEPMKPTFLIHNAKKEKMEEERQMKIYYENHKIVRKIIDITKKPSPYNIQVCQVQRCPAFDKTTFQKNKMKYDIDVDNMKLYKRLVSAQPYYKTDEVIKDHIKNKYFESMISQTKSILFIETFFLGNKNPSLHFETPENFKRRLENFISYQNNNNVSELSSSKSLPKSTNITNSINYIYLIEINKKPLSAITRASASTNYSNPLNDKVY